MDEEDQLKFTGSYKDLKMGICFDVSGKAPEEVAAVLSYISEQIEPYAFKFSGVAIKKVEDLVKLRGSGITAVCEFLDTNPASAIKKELLNTVPDPLLLPAAESCLLNRMLDKAGVGFRIPPKTSLKPASEKIEDFVGFAGKYKTWVAIKKFGIEGAQEYEISGILSGINHTLVNKAFDFAGIKKDDAVVEAAIRGKRRSFGNVTLCLRELEPKLNGSPDDAYLVCKALDELGYKPYASPDMLTDAHPDIKPPKVKGRKPKG